MKNKLNLLTGVVLGFILLLNSQNTKSQTNTNYGTNAGNSGSNNSCFGYYAGDPVTGNYNSFFGAISGGNNSTGSRNSFLGYRSGCNNLSGEWNTFIGTHSGYENTEGTKNTFIGAGAGYTNKTGNNNTFLGHYAGYYSTGGSNVFIGYSAGSRNTGGKNVFIGRDAGSQNTGDNNVFIGYQTGLNETGSNKLYIDNSSTSEPLIWGDFDSNVLKVYGKLEADDMEVISLLASKVNVNMPHLADYVFSSDYKLRSLKEVENFIEQNNRLPEMPSASEVKEKGLDIGEMNNLLLQKIEELTLYIIEQDKRIEELENNK